MDEPSSTPTPVEPLPAATVVLGRPGPDGLEVLLTRRPPTMAFGPDLHVFPGGRIDPQDGGSPIARELRSAGWPEDLARAGAAAARESIEEVGIEIGDPRRLASLSRWVTPRSLPRRFDVRFFVAEVAPATEAVPAHGEVVEALWLAPRDALAAMAAGRLNLWLPTSVTLQQLAWVGDLAELAGSLPAGPGGGAPGADAAGWRTFEPPGLPALGVETTCAGGVAGRTATTWLVGERDLVVVDPGDTRPEAAAHLERLAASRGARLVGVALTHLDPEHHAGVELFATDLGLPVVAGRGAARLAPYPLVQLADEALVPFGDVPLAAISLPGPSAEHTGYELVGRGAIACGDLLDPPLARVRRGVLPPPDLAAWAASRERLRALGRNAVLPSHGSAA